MKLFRKKTQINENCNLSLKTSRVFLTVDASIVLLTATQTYKNIDSSPIEVTYKFPRLNNSVLISLIIKLNDGSIIKASIHELDESLQMYQDAISSGNSAVLAQELKDNRLKFTIGNILPGESFIVELQLSYPVSCRDSFWEIFIPFDFLTDSKILKTFEIFLELKSPRKILNFSCNSQSSLNLTQGSLNLSGTIKTLKQEDIIIRYKTESFQVPLSFFQKVNNSFYTLTSFIPQAENNIQDAEGMGEFIFFLDRSGSMKGNKIDMAKKAALLFIKSLPEGSLFNIVSFGTYFNLMFSVSVENSTENVNFALDQIKRFDADLGDTDIFNPLRKIFSIESQTGYSKIIFLLTDGQVDDPELVIKLIKKNSSKFKVNTFGIGSDFDQNLIKKAAEAGKGSSNYVKNVSEIGKKVIITLSKCLSPTLSNWEILWDGENYPKIFGTLNYGERFVMFSKIDEIPKNPVTIKAFDNASRSFKTMEIREFQETRTNVFQLWANSKIKDLEENKEVNFEEIVKVSLESGVLSKNTVFFAQKINNEAIVSEMKIMKANKMIKIEDNCEDDCEDDGELGCENDDLSEGIIGDSEEEIKRSQSLENNMEDREKIDLQEFMFEDNRMNIKEIKSEIALKPDVKEEESDFRLKEKKLYKTDSKKSFDKLEFFNLISLQNSSGFWNYSDFTEESLLKKVPKDFVQCEDQENAICTLMVLAYLHKNFSKKHEEWFLIEKKALKWLNSRSVSYKSIEKELIFLLN